MTPTSLLGSPAPLVGAPMAGGPTTVALAKAVASAGGFAFLAGGYKGVEALGAEIAQLREGGAPFGVNLFVPGPDTLDRAAFASYAHELQSEADVYGLELDASPVTDDDDLWQDKLALLCERPVPVVSLTFGLPAPSDIRSLQQAGSAVLATVTTSDEARAAEAAGVDGLIVQGPSAGGHSGTFDPSRTIADVTTVDLVRQIRAVTGLPLTAAGGVDGPRAVRELLDAGAAAVAVGTLLLATDESGASKTHQNALLDPAFTETVLTRAFSGRPARGLRNGFIDRHEASAPLGYPAVHHLTRPLRQAAAKAGDADRLHVWAGTGYRNAFRGPAAQAVTELLREV